jgi:hypothetical protein
MRRALHIGLFIGTLIGMAACGTIEQGQSWSSANSTSNASHIVQAGQSAT